MLYLKSSEQLTQEMKGPLSQPSMQQKDESVLVDLDEIIKEVKYTFHPFIHGKQVHLKWQEDVIKDNARFIVVLGSRQ